MDITAGHKFSTWFGCRTKPRPALKGDARRPVERCRSCSFKDGAAIHPALGVDRQVDVRCSLFARREGSGRIICHCDQSLERLYRRRRRKCGLDDGRSDNLGRGDQTNQEYHRRTPTGKSACPACPAHNSMARRRGYSKVNARQSRGRTNRQNSHGAHPKQKWGPALLPAPICAERRICRCSSAWWLAPPAPRSWLTSSGVASNRGRTRRYVLDLPRPFLDYPLSRRLLSEENRVSRQKE